MSRADIGQTVACLEALLAEALDVEGVAECGDK